MRVIVETLAPKALEDGAALPGALLTELTALYASNEEFQQLSGDFPDPSDIRPEQVAAALAEELAQPTAEVLLARSGAGSSPSPSPWAATPTRPIPIRGSGC